MYFFSCVPFLVYDFLQDGNTVFHTDRWCSVYEVWRIESNKLVPFECEVESDCTVCTNRVTARERKSEVE